MTYAPASEIHNFHPGNTARITQSLEDAQDGELVEWVVNSDSSATLAITGVGTYDHLQAWPILMLDELELAGVPIAGTGMVRRLDNTIVDHRWTQTGTWYFNFLTFAYTVTNGATSIFTTDRAGDHVAVRWYDGGAAEASSMSITVAAGTPTVVNTSATPGWRTTIVAEDIDVGETVVITKVSGAYTSIAAACVWDEAAGGLLLHNVGQGGSYAVGTGSGHDRWIADNVRESLGQVFADVTVTGNDPALVILPLGGNDKKNAVSDTNVLNGIQTIRERYPNSDCLLIGENQLNDIYVTQATWETYLAALYVRATAIDVPVIDQYARLGDYDAVVAAGKNADTAGHLTPTALEDLGRSLGALLAQQLTLGDTPMAYTARLYSNFLKALANKEIDFDSDTIKGILLTSSYTPDYDAHDYKNDLTNEVAAGGGYTTGGLTIANCTLAVIAANSWGTSRANATAYVAGQVVRPASGNGFLYQAATSGTSGGSVPTYPTTIGGTVADGGVTWVCVGRSVLKIDGDDVTWDPSTITAAYLALVDTTPATDATRPLVLLIDFGGNVSSLANELKVAFHADGIINAIVA